MFLPARACLVRWPSQVRVCLVCTCQQLSTAAGSQAHNPRKTTFWMWKSHGGKPRMIYKWWVFHSYRRVSAPCLECLHMPHVCRMLSQTPPAESQSWPFIYYVLMHGKPWAICKENAGMGYPNMIYSSCSSLFQQGPPEARDTFCAAPRLKLATGHATTETSKFFTGCSRWSPKTLGIRYHLAPENRSFQQKNDTRTEDFTIEIRPCTNSQSLEFIYSLMM